MLWAEALREASSLLDISHRAHAARDAPETRAKDGRAHAAFGDYLARQPDGARGFSFEHMLEFDATYEKEFGGLKDLAKITHSCRMLAVVLFCQILKPGNDDPGVVDSNSRSFINLHLGELLNIACMGEDERGRFQVLREQIERARDKMLGHADAKAFNVEQDLGVVKILMFHRALDGIDFEDFASLVRKLLDALSEYTAVDSAAPSYTTPTP